MIFLIFLLASFLQSTYSISINQTILFEKYRFNINSVVIDLSEKSIDNIDTNTFQGCNKLEKLFLQDNKIKILEYGLFNNLENLKELWLENNNIISIDRNIFIGLDKLQKVCLNENPISLMFPNNIKPLYDTPNPNCDIKINEKCIKDNTISNYKLNTKDILLSNKHQK